MQGAIACLEALGDLQGADLVSVVRAYVRDPDPFLAGQRWALRWLDAARANRYLQESAAPARSNLDTLGPALMADGTPVPDDEGEYL